MSALGHKRTSAPQYVVSALLPIATAKADICPEGMSVLDLKADMCGAVPHVCFGPIADITALLNDVAISVAGYPRGTCQSFNPRETRHVCRMIARQLVPRFSHFNQGGSVFGVAGSRSKFAALFAVLMILGRFFHLLIPYETNAHAYRLVPHADARVSRVVVHLANAR